MLEHHTANILLVSDAQIWTSSQTTVAAAAAAAITTATATAAAAAAAADEEKFPRIPQTRRRSQRSPCPVAPFVRSFPVHGRAPRQR